MKVIMTDVIINALTIHTSVIMKLGIWLTRTNLALVGPIMFYGELV